MYAGHVAYCPLVSQDEYADGTGRQTGGWTPDRYITFTVRRGLRNNEKLCFCKKDNSQGKCFTKLGMTKLSHALAITMRKCNNSYSVM